MNFWEDTGLNDYVLYEKLKQNKDWGRMAEWLPTLLQTYPKLVPYVINKIDSCFGKHRVYIIHTNFGIKLGYTKNSIEERFAEKRYQGSNNFEIKEILREEEFQAYGASEFESLLKNKFKEFSIKTEMVMPGKGELYDINFKQEILSIYDLYKNEYKQLIGIKPPN